MRVFFLAFAVVITAALASAAQEAVFVIRHAEKELRGEDPAITNAGRNRAAAWADMLQHAGLDIVITSDARRTQQTGQVIANKLGLPLTSMNRNDTAGLIDTLSFDHAEDTVLVVGHAETIPGILRNLGASEEIDISQTDFANLFVLTQSEANDPYLIRMRMP